jgi:hypothetical protein
MVTGFKNLVTNDALSRVADDFDQTVSSALAKAVFPVRGEKFARPEQSHSRTF